MNFENLFTKTWRPFFWIALLIFIVYFQALFFQFSYLDDNQLIIDNFHFIKDLGNIGQAFFTDVFLSSTQAYYRPLLNVSFIIDAQFGGAEPFFYHLSNILMHVITCWLLFILLLKLRYNRLKSFFFSLLFALHPVISQAVAWVPGRNDSLAAIFVLSSIIMLINYLDIRDSNQVEAPVKNKRRQLQKQNKFQSTIQVKLWSYYGLHLVFFTLALFTKESVMLTAFVGLAYLHLIRKEKVFSGTANFFIAGWVATTALLLTMRHIAFTNPLQANPGDIIASWFMNCPVAIQYLGKMLFPINQSVLPVIKDTTFIYGLIALGALSFAIYSTKHKRWSYLGFGLSWIVIFMAPTFIWPSPEIVTFLLEHRLYLPLIGLIIVLLETKAVDSIFSNPKRAITTSVVILLIFSGLTYKHSHNFADRIAFWKNAAETSPHSPLAQRNLGAMYYLAGEIDKAEIQYKKALELFPNEAMAHMNLGLVYAQKKQFQLAETEYLKELQINPNYENALSNLALLYYYNLGKTNEALALWKRTVEINPNYLGAFEQLAVHYYRVGNYPESVYYVNQILNRGGQVNPALIEELRKKIGL